MTILITGANRGIGRGLMEAFAARGDEVIGTARRPQPGLLTCDVKDPAAVAELPAALGDRPLDLLVCNAGVYPDKGHRIGAGYGPEVWAEAFAVNVTGVFLTIEALLPALRAAKGRTRGRIAILSSIMASDARAPGGSYAYRASKAAALNLGRNLATDLRGDGIAVGIYHPGWVRTDMGGPGADIDLGPAVAGLVARFDALDIDATGCFLSYDGTPIDF